MLGDECGTGIFLPSYADPFGGQPMDCEYYLILWGLLLNMGALSQVPN
jgi:hypothetical protein